MNTRMQRYLAAGGVMLSLASGSITSLRAQDPRDALVARAFNEFDAARRLQLLTSAVNPTAGPPRGAWPVGVQLLAQTLIEDHRDSLAGLWLRWAVRLSPDLQPDTVQFLPQVIGAYRAAHDFVLRTRATSDTAAPTTWLWPAGQAIAQDGALQVAASPAPLRVEIEGVGVVVPGARVPLAPGSYAMTASATSGDSIRAIREVLPGVTTVVEFRLQPLVAELAQEPGGIADDLRRSAGPAPRKFPIKRVVLGGIATAGAVAFLVSGGGHVGGNKGGITITFPNR